MAGNVKQEKGKPMNATSKQGLTTAQAIDMQIRLAEVYGREITDGTARAIADSFHDGSALTLAFVSTGTIPDESSDLWHALFPEYPGKLSSRERNWANWLGTYLINRKDRNCPVDGWANLWADTDL